MEAPIHICPATSADAGLISRILERSIRVGCALDHRNDPQLVDRWVRRQSAEHISGWLADPHLYLNIALLHDKPVGVGMAAANGEITFCHVQPEWFRRGAGRALMGDLEGWLRVRGRPCVMLASTRTGEAFYRRLGYREAASAFTHHGVLSLPMHKPLALSA
ncbi:MULTISPECIES: GNAT family N-acetyltransferase [unclassified Pseudomonas]|uniref:GNAT family N-acetyltransferase n=1 Tax=Pseudomonas syringae TaxID=317 RepID=A0A3T0JXL7_PSESX|nr:MULTISPECIES: GNAT family N-acetyltransferase [unclassified Pseudomonas]AZV28193.1 GNAT family N-acetyltransferase [Pseudomonas syringae]